MTPAGSPQPARSIGETRTTVGPGTNVNVNKRSCLAASLKIVIQDGSRRRERLGAERKHRADSVNDEMIVEQRDTGSRGQKRKAAESAEAAGEPGLVALRQTAKTVGGWRQT